MGRLIEVAGFVALAGALAAEFGGQRPLAVVFAVLGVAGFAVGSTLRRRTAASDVEAILEAAGTVGLVGRDGEPPHIDDVRMIAPSANASVTGWAHGSVRASKVRLVALSLHPRESSTAFTRYLLDVETRALPGWLQAADRTPGRALFDAVPGPEVATGNAAIDDAWAISSLDASSAVARIRWDESIASALSALPRGTAFEWRATRLVFALRGDLDPSKVTAVIDTVITVAERLSAGLDATGGRRPR